MCHARRPSTVRMAALRAQRYQAIANANAAAGGIQVIEQLLATLDVPEPLAEQVGALLFSLQDSAGGRALLAEIPS